MKSDRSFRATAGSSPEALKAPPCFRVQTEDHVRVQTEDHVRVQTEDHVRVQTEDHVRVHKLHAPRPLSRCSCDALENSWNSLQAMFKMEAETLTGVSD
ncbi:hypothetical protein EYF80_054266 [Liparis tanakae]|uniref:Uncharacterized protein n=1 Tax=Liparis tanakae TaxID=230148 RepID=A0A4Z2F338_9TELE|nr:hypothetical protein EYF80_054266 [Liparis tanakae]